MEGENSYTIPIRLTIGVTSEPQGLVSCRPCKVILHKMELRELKDAQPWLLGDAVGDKNWAERRRSAVPLVTNSTETGTDRR